MAEQQNVAAVQQIYQAFGRGDIPAILNATAEGAVMHHSGPADVLPWARSYRGATEWSEFFKTLGETVDVEAFEPREFIAQGDAVIALGYYRMKAKRTGSSFESEWAMAWRFLDGKATEVRVYEDTAPMADALRQR